MLLSTNSILIRHMTGDLTSLHMHPTTTTILPSYRPGPKPRMLRVTAFDGQQYHAFQEVGYVCTTPAWITPAPATLSASIQN